VEGPCVFPPRGQFVSAQPPTLLTVSEAVTHPISRISAGVNRKSPLKLSDGGREMDSMAKALCESGTAGQLDFFGGRMAGVVGISYLLHRTGHHGNAKLDSLQHPVAGKRAPC
jgi:hypothetical protein